MLAPTGQQATTTADIARASITVSGLTAQNRTYDGTTAATVVTSGATLSGFISGDSLSVSATGTFDTRNAGTGKTVTISDLALQGGDAGNYVLAPTGQQATTTADIARANLTLAGSFGAENKIFDGTTSARLTGLGGLSLAGVVNGDAVSLSTADALGRFDSAQAGAGRRVSLVPGSLGLSGAAAGNYLISWAGAPTATAVITSKDQGVSIIPEWIAAPNLVPVRRTVADLCKDSGAGSQSGRGCVAEPFSNRVVLFPSRLPGPGAPSR